MDNPRVVTIITLNYIALVLSLAPAVVSADGTRGAVQGAPEYFVLRDGLANSQLSFTREHRGRVVFLGGSITQTIRQGQQPVVIANYDSVAQHYGRTALDLATEVTRRIDAGEFTWEKDFKDLHPAPFGHDLYAKSIARVLDAAWGNSTTAGDAFVKPHPLPRASWSLPGMTLARWSGVWTAPISGAWISLRSGVRPCICPGLTSSWVTYLPVAMDSGCGSPPNRIRRARDTPSVSFIFW